MLISNILIATNCALLVVVCVLVCYLRNLRKQNDTRMRKSAERCRELWNENNRLKDSAMTGKVSINIDEMNPYGKVIINGKEIVVYPGDIQSIPKVNSAGTGYIRKHLIQLIER